jgi:hypothetical protein
MARKNPQDPQDTTQPAELEGAADAAATPRPPQGIVVSYKKTGQRSDFHPRYATARMIDPASLMRADDGEDPYLALPIEGDRQKVCIRQVGAVHAAEMLSCDPASGGASIHRLATDDEVAEEKKREQERRDRALGKR